MKTLTISLKNLSQDFSWIKAETSYEAISADCSVSTTDHSHNRRFVEVTAF